MLRWRVCERRIFGGNGGGFGEVGAGFVLPVEREQRGGAVAEDVGVGRCEGQCGVEGFEGFGISAEEDQGVSAAAVGFAKSVADCGCSAGRQSEMAPRMRSQVWSMASARGVADFLSRSFSFT